MATKGKMVDVRVLMDGPIEGVPYKINQVVSMPEGVAKAHEKIGSVDTHPDSVAYAKSELNAKTVVHAPAQPEAEGEGEGEGAGGEGGEGGEKSTGA